MPLASSLYLGLFVKTFSEFRLSAYGICLISILKFEFDGNGHVLTLFEVCPLVYVVDQIGFLEVFCENTIQCPGKCI